MTTDDLADETSTPCGGCGVPITPRTAWMHELTGPVRFVPVDPSGTLRPVRIDQPHYMFCGPCSTLVTAGRLGDLAQRVRDLREREGAPPSNAVARSEELTMTLTIVAKLGPGEPFVAWHDRRTG